MKRNGLWISLMLVAVVGCGGRSFDKEDSRGKKVKPTPDAGASGSCELEGDELADGDSIQVACNTCTCEDGELACTEMECDPTCEFEGEQYAAGEVRNESCNLCECSDGDWSCTTLDCSADCHTDDGRTVQHRASVPGLCGETCICQDGALSCEGADPAKCGDPLCTVGGMDYAPGAPIPTDEECVTCSCQEGEQLCEKIDDCGMSCRYAGLTRQHGSQFRVDCEQCSCDDGTVTCDGNGCNPSSCTVEGITYGHGVAVPTGDHCEACVCDAGTVECRKVECNNPCSPEVEQGAPSADPAPDVALQPPPPELPKAPPVPLPPEEPNPELCESCQCVDGREVCSAVPCPPAACTLGGVSHPHGSRQSGIQGCQTCTCNDGTWSECSGPNICPQPDGARIQPCATPNPERHSYDEFAISDDQLQLRLPDSDACVGLCYVEVDDAPFMGATNVEAYLVEGLPGCQQSRNGELSFSLRPLAEAGHTNVFIELPGKGIVLYEAAP